MPRTPTCGVLHVKQGPGLLEIVRKRSAWGSWIGHFCSNYFLYFLLTWLPFYLVSERHFSVNGMAKVGGSTFLMAAMSALICGRLSDRWICAGATPTRVRKTFMVVGMTCNGLFLAGCAIAPKGLLVALLLLAGASFGLINSNLNAITQTLAGPQGAGRWMGAQNFVANLAGAVAPALTGFLVDRTGQFYWPFLITATVTWVGALQWGLVVGPVEPIAWKVKPKPAFAGIARNVHEPSARIP